VELHRPLVDRELVGHDGRGPQKTEKKKQRMRSEGSKVEDTTRPCRTANLIHIAHHPTRRSGLVRCMRRSSSCSCCCTERKRASTFVSLLGWTLPSSRGDGEGCGCFAAPRWPLSPLALRCCEARLRARAISRFRLARASAERSRRVAS